MNAIVMTAEWDPRPGYAITPRERQLVESYRRLSTDDRAEVDGYVDYKLFRARRERPAHDGF